MNKHRQNVEYDRNPIYVFYALGAIGLFLLCALLANQPQIGPLEQTIFDLFYKLPDKLTPIFKFITLFGTIVAALLASIALLIFRRRDVSLRLFVASSTAYIAAMLLKDLFSRSRPEELLNYVIPRDQAIGLGFPSGHMATATAMGLTLALYAPRSLRKWIILAIILVGVSRVYLGVHLPLDIVGGFAIGLFFYSFTSLVFGSKYFPINLNNLVNKLKAGGMIDLTLKPASVDARGSVPFFGEYKGGKVFVKVFNQENNAADWLFKLVRRIRYRRLEDEIPSLTPKRTIEHEAYLTMLAKYTAGVRAPEIVGVFNVATNSFAMATLLLDATGLDKMEKSQVTDKMLKGVWEQVVKLHEHRIIHKDLRTANVMVEKKTGLPWIIDFGFSESAVDSHQYYKDNVEFIASTATIVGAKRAVEAAKNAIGKQGILDAIPYMQYAALSSATTSALKNNKQLFKDIRTEMYKAANVDSKAVKNAKISRISKNNLFQVAVILLLFAILAPQISSLKESIVVLKTTDLTIYFVALLFSILTYVWAALSYKLLSDIPISFRRLYVVEWAGSFANRLLPAGLGSLGFNTMFMMKNGHNEGESGTIALVNNTLGVISSVTLIIIAVLIFSSSLNLLEDVEVSLKNILIVGLIIAALVIVLIVIYKRSKSLQTKIKKWFAESKESLKNYAQKPLVLFSAYGAQLLITLTYTAVMIVSALSLNVDLNFTQALFAVSLGTLIGSITPTPGGIGGAEAGIVTALTIVGIPMETAIAIAILYRLATFWFTIPPGYAAYRYSFAKNYFS